MAVAAYNSLVLITAQPSIATTNEATSTSDLTTFSITSATHRYFDPTVAVTVQAQYNEIQSITITGSPTGGSYTISYTTQTSGAIAYNATAAQMQTAIQAMSTVGAGNVLVTGGTGAYTVQFTGALAGASNALYGVVSSLTGGSSPNAVLATVQSGATWATITSGFSMFRCNARVVFAVAQPTGTQVRFSTASYFAYSTLAEASSADFSGKYTMDDTTTFNTSGTHSYIPTTLEGTLKLTTFWISQVRATSFLARDLLVVSFVTPSSNRYEGFCYGSDMDLKYDPKKAINQDITFTLTNEFFTV